MLYEQARCICENCTNQCCGCGAERNVSLWLLACVFITMVASFAFNLWQNKKK